MITDKMTMGQITFMIEFMYLIQINRTIMVINNIIKVCLNLE